MVSAVDFLRTSFRTGSGDEALAMRSLPELNAAIAFARRTYVADGSSEGAVPRGANAGAEPAAGSNADSRHLLATVPAAGSFLIASPSLDGAFARSIVLILEHSSRGTFGVVLCADDTLRAVKAVDTSPSSLPSEAMGGGLVRSAEAVVRGLSDCRPLLDWSASASAGLASSAARALGLPSLSLVLDAPLHQRTRPHTSQARRQRIIGADSAALCYFKRASTQARLSEAEIILGKLHAVRIPALDGPRSVLLMAMAGGTMAHSLLPLGPGLDTPAPLSVIAEQDAWDAAAWQLSNASGGVRLPSNVILTDAENGKGVDRRVVAQRRIVRQRLSLQVAQRRAAHCSVRRGVLGPRVEEAAFGRQFLLSAHKRAFFHVRSIGEERWLKRLEAFDAFNASGMARTSDFSDYDEEDEDQEEDFFRVADESDGGSSRQNSPSIGDDDDFDDTNNEDDDDDNAGGHDGGDADTILSTAAADTENADVEQQHRSLRQRRGLSRRISKSANTLRGIVSHRDLQALRNAISAGGDLSPRMMENMNVVKAVFSGAAVDSMHAVVPAGMLSQDAGDGDGNDGPVRVAGDDDTSSLESSVLRIYSRKQLSLKPDNSSDDTMMADSTTITGTDVASMVVLRKDDDNDNDDRSLDLERLLRDGAGDDLDPRDEDAPRERRSQSLIARTVARHGSHTFLTRCFAASLSVDSSGTLFAPLPHKAGAGEGALAFVPSTLPSGAPSIVFLGTAARMKVDQARVTASAFAAAVKSVASSTTSSHAVSPTINDALPLRRSGGPVEGFSFALHSSPDLARVARRRGAKVVTLPCASKTPVFITRCDARSLSGARGAGQRALTFNSSAVWSAGQLLGEISSGSWVVTSADHLWGETARAASSADAWSSALRSLGGEYAAVLAAVPSRRSVD